MRTLSLSLTMAALLAPVLGHAQARPDFNGLWDGAANTTNIVQYMKNKGTPVPFTPLGKQRYDAIDMAKNPNAFCLPRDRRAPSRAPPHSRLCKPTNTSRFCSRTTSTIG